MVLYGLNRYRKDQLENLEEEWVEKAIKEAKEKGCVPTVSLCIRLKKEHEKQLREGDKQKQQQIIAEKILQAVPANDNLPYDGAIIDLTAHQTLNKELNLMKLPLAQDAVIFVVVQPKDAYQTQLALGQDNFRYVDNVVWDRDIRSGTAQWSTNQHLHILIFTKGNPNQPMPEFRLQSIYFEHKEDKILPDYYFAMMENICPGGLYLDVFCNRLFSNRWHTFNLKESTNDKN